MTTIVIIIIVFVAIRVIAQIVSDNQAKEYQKQRNDNRRNASLENPVRKNKLGAYSKSIVYEELSRRGQFGNIFVYSDAKTIVICGREYKFDEIVECHLESQGATYVTTPDRYQMAEQQFLYGMGQRYNVSTQTQVYNKPTDNFTPVVNPNPEIQNNNNGNNIVVPINPVVVPVETKVVQVQPIQIQPILPLEPVPVVQPTPVILPPSSNKVESHHHSGGGSSNADEACGNVFLCILCCICYVLASGLGGGH